MKNFIEFINTHSVNYALINGYLTMFLIIAIGFIIAMYLRLKEAKTWIKFSEIEKKQNRSELKEEKTFCETQGNMYSKLLVRHSELKKWFDDAVAEITELRSKVKLLESCNQDNLNSITHWKERALHQKHTKKVVESELCECLINDFNPNFISGNKYRIGTRIKSNSLISLFNENGVECILNRKNFKPVTK